MFRKRKKELILLGMVALVICLGVVNNRLNSNESLSANVDYVQYEQDEMTLHDGEILVDSTGIALEQTTDTGVRMVVSPTEEEQAAREEAEKQGGPDGATLVTSDNYEELQSAGAYFEEARASVNMDRNEIMAMLQEVIDTYGDQNVPEKNQAADQKLKIIDYMNKEKVTEDILKTKGFEKVFVLITDNSVNITIDKQDVSRSDVAKIVDVVTRETGRSLDQITIQSKV